MKKVYILDKIEIINELHLIMFIFILIAVFCLIVRRRTKYPLSKILLIFGIVTNIICFTISGLSILFNLMTKSTVEEVVKRKKYKMVEGVISNFIPSSPGAHFDESFVIDSVKFNYRDNSYKYGFKKTSGSGGPINDNGDSVKIIYIEQMIGENRIIYIEKN
jgi:hypothetical protein